MQSNKNKKMNRVEFKTVVHNGIIEIPKDNPEIKDKEVNVIILWEEKPLKESKKKKTKVSDLKARIKTKMTNEEIEKQINTLRNEWERGI